MFCTVDGLDSVTDGEIGWIDDPVQSVYSGQSHRPVLVLVVVPEPRGPPPHHVAAGPPQRGTRHANESGAARCPRRNPPEGTCRRADRSESPEAISILCKGLNGYLLRLLNRSSPSS